MSKSIEAGGAALIATARAVRANAHAPYSGFEVGAALRTVTGLVFQGANVENASYPEGICAEGAAIAAMVAAGERRIAAIAIVGPRRIAPCGGCRQKIAEFAGPETLVLMAGAGDDTVETTTIGVLLPRGFTLDAKDRAARDQR